MEGAFFTGRKAKPRSSCCVFGRKESNKHGKVIGSFCLVLSFVLILGLDIESWLTWNFLESQTVSNSPCSCPSFPSTRIGSVCCYIQQSCFFWSFWMLFKYKSMLGRSSGRGTQSCTPLPVQVAPDLPCLPVTSLQLSTRLSRGLDIVLWPLHSNWAAQVWKAMHKNRKESLQSRERHGSVPKTQKHLYQRSEWTSMICTWHIGCLAQQELLHPQCA